MALIDYLVLTPLDEEWRAVRSALCPPPLKFTEHPAETFTYYLCTQPVNRPPNVVGEYLVAAAPMSRRTPGPAYAAAFSAEAIRAWRPSRVVLLGIAGSLDPDRLQLGDVVVSDQIYGYEVGDATPGGIDFRPTFNQIGALDYDRVRAFRDSSQDYPRWQQECLEAIRAEGFTVVNRPPELHLEATASGNLVVKSAEFRQKLNDTFHTEVSAVEMEARGLHQAVYLSAHRADALMIRGVSDYADERKAELEKASKDRWRAVAVANAARLLRAVWQRGPVPPGSPAYQLDLSRGPHSRFRQPGMPPIEFKHKGAQDVAFPQLLNRSRPTPRLLLRLGCASRGGQPVDGFRAACVVESPIRQILTAGAPAGGVTLFRLPESEWGLRVEVLLSSPSAVDRIEVSVEDEFGRSARDVAERPPEGSAP